MTRRDKMILAGFYACLAIAFTFQMFMMMGCGSGNGGGTPVSADTIECSVCCDDVKDILTIVADNQETLEDIAHKVLKKHHKK